MTLTKRSVLRFEAKIYDPLGLLSPFTIRLKLLFQELCHDLKEWDSNLSHEHKKKYLKLISTVSQMPRSLPACIAISTFSGFNQRRFAISHDSVSLDRLNDNSVLDYKFSSVEGLCEE